MENSKTAFRTKNLLRINAPQLKKEIGKQQLKLWWLAEESGIHRTTLRRWLDGSCPRVGKNRLEKVAEVLKVNAAELYL